MPCEEEDIQDMEDNLDKVDNPPCEVASRTVLPRNPVAVADIPEAESHRLPSQVEEIHHIHGEEEEDNHMHLEEVAHREYHIVERPFP